MTFPWWSVAPFVIMLACVALGPVIPGVARAWEHNGVKLAVALVLGVPVAIWVLVVAGPGDVEHSLTEYAQFIALLASLFVVTGGLVLDGDLRATPRNNTIMLGIGAVLASFIGTTGAAMMLIRPLLQTNRERESRAHTVCFAILIVANCGGMLTPLGDPPLYMGFMRGVPFGWTFTLTPMWAFINGLLLLSYYAIDRRSYVQESAFSRSWDDAARTPLRLRGTSNIVWLAVIVLSVALLGEWTWVKVGVQAAAAIASYVITNKQLRFEDNEFTWTPILEVAAVFVGIFLTMIPALDVLRANAHALPLNEYTLFGFTGLLSSVLDNAPTYLVFFEMATQLSVPGMPLVAGVPVLFLEAISLGAVACGALTYIGNGPNFMVKAVAEHHGVTMPAFGTYVWRAARDLVPVVVAMVCLFWGGAWPVRLAGALVAAAVVAHAVVLIVRYPLPKH